MSKRGERDGFIRHTFQKFTLDCVRNQVVALLPSFLSLLFLFLDCFFRILKHGIPFHNCGAYSPI